MEKGNHQGSLEAVCELVGNDRSMELIFLDTETTGTDVEKDKICQIAYKYDGKMYEELIKPSIPIKIDAMATHHITNEMVADAPSFEESNSYSHLKTLFTGYKTVLVAHNAQFDVSMLQNDWGIKPNQVICTLRVARHLDTEAILPRYSLQYLRYALQLQFDEEINPHKADSDVLVLEGLYKRLEEKMFKNMNIPFPMPEDVLPFMVEITANPSFISRISFGKYNGEKILDIAKKDPGYIRWLLGEKEKETPKDRDWIYTLSKCLNT